jgi:hypothetical protein
VYGHRQTAGKNVTWNGPTFGNVLRRGYMWTVEQRAQSLVLSRQLCISADNVCVKKKILCKVLVLKRYEEKQGSGGVTPRFLNFGIWYRQVAGFTHRPIYTTVSPPVAGVGPTARLGVGYEITAPDGNDTTSSWMSPVTQSLKWGSALGLINYKIKVKGKVHPRTGHEGQSGEYRYSSTLSLTSGLDGVDDQRHFPAVLPPGKTRYPLYRTLGGPHGRSGRVRKYRPPPGFDPRTVQPVARLR